MQDDRRRPQPHQQRAHPGPGGEVKGGERAAHRRVAPLDGRKLRQGELHRQPAAHRGAVRATVSFFVPRDLVQSHFWVGLPGTCILQALL